MPPGDRDDHGLYGIVFAIALLLALTLVFYGVKRYVWKGGKVRRPVHVQPTAQNDSRTDRAPSIIPGVKLKRVEGHVPSRRRKSVPPAIPQPPAAPDRE
jgi:hypothetical protein